MMGRVDLSGTAIAITQVGFGCARIYGGLGQALAARLIETALSCGIRHFDTAPVYGDGQSEEVIGSILRGIPDVTIATKVGLTAKSYGPAERSARAAYRQFVKPLLARVPRLKSAMLRAAAGGHTGAEQHDAVERRRLDPSQVRRELESSLRKLKRERVEIYLVHEPDQFELDEPILRCFTDLMREGLVGAFGLGYGRTVDDAPEFGAVVQSQYSGAGNRRLRNETRIMHGALRFGWNAEASVGRYFRGVLDENPETAFIFSASSTSQIGQVMSDVR